MEHTVNLNESSVYSLREQNPTRASSSDSATNREQDFVAVELHQNVVCMDTRVSVTFTHYAQHEI